MGGAKRVSSELWIKQFFLKNQHSTLDAIYIYNILIFIKISTENEIRVEMT